ncbi:calcium homeostasis endoplasmic reticulum protein isoform X5 [Rhinoraja longicauda]
MDMPVPPEDQELRNVIDKLAQFVARNGPEFEKMTMEKQKENPKFSFLFGGEYYNYYQYKLAIEQQFIAVAPVIEGRYPENCDFQGSLYSRDLQVLCSPSGQENEPPTQVPVPAPIPGPLPAAPSTTMPGPATAPAQSQPPTPPGPGQPQLEELIQQSLWNLQQQEQHLLMQRQEQITAAIALAMEQQIQKLLSETQLDMTEFDNLLQPIIDTCTKDAISAGKNWMFNNAKTPQHCELMSGHLRNRITAEGAHFELRLHLIYLINDVLHHCQRKQARDLLAALQKVVVPIYCTSFLAVEEDKQQKIARLLQLWEKNGYFDESIIQQLQSPALGLGQYQASLITEFAAVVQPIQMAFQQQIQTLKAQHQEFVDSLTKHQQAQPPPQPQPQPQSQPQPQPLLEPEAPPPHIPMPQNQDLPVLSPTDSPAPECITEEPKPHPLPDNVPSGGQEPPSGGQRGPGQHEHSSSKPPWFERPAMPLWGQQQQQQQQQQFDQGFNAPHQGPPHCQPWNNNHEGMWNDQREQNWNNQRDAPWNNQHEPSWNNQYDPPWNNQHEPPWGGQRDPPFRMQRPPHFRQQPPFQQHQQHPPFNQPPHPHNFNRIPPRFMQDDFPPRHHFDRPPYPPHHFDYQQGDFPPDMGPPHHPPHRLPPPGMGEPPPWGGPQHPDFGGPPPGFNGQPPHIRRQGPPPPQITPDDPSLVPNVPYFDLPAGLMAPLVKLEDYDYKALESKDMRLPPPMPPNERLLAAVEAFYSPPSHDRPRNSEGWEQNGLYEFFRAKMRARRKKGQDKRSRGPSTATPGTVKPGVRSEPHEASSGPKVEKRGRSKSRSRSRSRRSSSGSSSRSSRSSGSYSRSRSRTRSRSRSRSYSASRSSRSRSGSSRSQSGSRSRSRSRSFSPGKRRVSRSRSQTPPATTGLGSDSASLTPDYRLGEENKGHQLLMKMGWSGSGGLGAKEQGIQDPIKGGEIRDKWDQYKGVGVPLDDPYENYRRNKSYSFIARMKARDEMKKEIQEQPPPE